jgi:hypothetical protein
MPIQSGLPEDASLPVNGTGAMMKLSVSLEHWLWGIHGTVFPNQLKMEK